MSGICGITGRDTRLETVNDMLSVMSHRGPSGILTFDLEEVALGCCALHPIPSVDCEPLTSLNGNHVAITADARIDNRDELIDLLLPDYGSIDRLRLGDSRLILIAYLKWGKDCVERFLGDFVFALWDNRHKELICARDHFGVKPFYYHSNGEKFSFASQIKPLLHILSQTPELNDFRIAQYLTDVITYDTSLTFYKNIFRLPPGHLLVVRKTGLVQHRYWKLQQSPLLKLSSDADYAEAFLDVFSNAVKCRMRFPAKVGTFLSGGLDSSSITCLAAKHAGANRIKTYSAVFDNIPDSDERFYMNLVVDKVNSEATFVRADQLSPLTSIEAMLDYEDEPFYAGNLYMHWAIYAAARNNGITVLLDGIDGDNIVSHGIYYLRELAASTNWKEFSSYAKGLARSFVDEGITAEDMFALHGADCFRKFARDGATPFAVLSSALRIALGLGISVKNVLSYVLTDREYRLPGRLSRDRIETRMMLLTSTLAADVPIREWLVQCMENDPEPTSEMQGQYQALTSGVVPFVFEIADRASAAFSVETRYPYFDKRVVEFCMSLPPQQKISKKCTRVVLRRAMAELLPQQVQQRGGKGNLGHNFTMGLLTKDKPIIDDVLENPGELERYVNMDVFRTMYSKFRLDGESNLAPKIWQIASLGIWLRRMRTCS